MLNIYIDGSVKDNPGPAAVGVVVADEEGETLIEFGHYLGRTTNNVAEYYALIMGLEQALILKCDSVTVHTDSQLLARQVSGRYKVKNEVLKSLHGWAKRLQAGFKHFQVKHIPRSQNKLADRLANQTLHQALKQS